MDKRKLELLKRKNRRKNLASLFSSTLKDFNMSSFLDIETNDIITKRLFDLLDKSKEEKVFGSTDLSQNIYDSKAYIKELHNISEKIKEEKTLLFYFGKYEIEAIYINIKDLLENLEDILTVMKFDTGNSDFILIEERLKFGFCIERGEYCFRIFRWDI